MNQTPKKTEGKKAVHAQSEQKSKLSGQSRHESQGNIKHQIEGESANQNLNRTSVRQVEILADQADQRIDNFLISTLKTIPRSLVYRLLRTGQVRVNKGRIKPSHRLVVGDIVRIPPVTLAPQQAARVPREVLRQIESAVIASESNWIVINKPAGVAVHGGTGVAFGVIDAIKEVFDDDSISLVHRLDKATSGVMVLARNRLASVHFQKALVSGKVSKRYVTILCGALSKPSTVNARLRKTHPTASENQVVVDPAGGKDALSRFKTKVAGSRFSLVDVEIETGRTHQIRVHAASIGHPVLGDDRYGDEKMNRLAKQLGMKRMFLHAHEIAFPDLSAEADDSAVIRTFTVPFDPEWQDYVTL